MGTIGVGRDTRPSRNYKVGGVIPVPYHTMKTKEICKMNVLDFAEQNCHLWLWTTNQKLHDAFHVMEEWGFKYLNTITWAKPSGIGPWFANRTQHLLFGYRGKLSMGEGRYAPTIFNFIPKRHSKKPESSFGLIESISFKPYLELFARPLNPMFPKRFGWDVWGDEIVSDIEFSCNQGDTRETGG